MQLRTYDTVTGLRLDSSTFTPETPRQLRMLQSIAVETEKTRAALRSDPNWAVQVPRPVRGFVPKEKRQTQSETALVDLLPWPALLTLEDCANNAAQHAGCNEQDILNFALSICPYEHIVTVVNFIGMKTAILGTAKILSPLILGLKDKESRIKKGGSVGGKKSARTRKSKSNVPEDTELLKHRGRLLDSGTAAKDVVSILAIRFGVHSSNIRRKLHAAEKAQEE